MTSPVGVVFRVRRIALCLCVGEQADKFGLVRKKKWTR